MGKPKEILFGDESSGVGIEYVKSKKLFHIYGYYDHFVGIKDRTISLKDFCKKLGITEKDLKGVFKND